MKLELNAPNTNKNRINVLGYKINIQLGKPRDKKYINRFASVQKKISFSEL